MIGNRPTFGEILGTIDDVVVEALISDNTARRFWRAKFADRVKVPWKEFSSAFSGSVPVLLNWTILTSPFGI